MKLRTLRALGKCHSRVPLPFPRHRHHLHNSRWYASPSTNLEHPSCNGTQLPRIPTRTPHPMVRRTTSNDLEPSNIPRVSPNTPGMSSPLPFPRTHPRRCRSSRCLQTLHDCHKNMPMSAHPPKAPRVTRPLTRTTQTCLRHTRTTLRYPKPRASRGPHPSEPLPESHRGDRNRVEAPRETGCYGDG